jgi:hypothetical protein
MRIGSSCADLALAATASSMPFEDWSFVCGATDRDRWIDPANLRAATDDVDRLSLHRQSKPDDRDGHADAADRLSDVATLPRFKFSTNPADRWKVMLSKSNYGPETEQ